MANVTTVARPYAKAILAIAKASDSFAAWTNMLQELALVAQDRLGHKILSNLAMSKQEKIDFIFAVVQNHLTEQGKNLVKLLAREKRLLILPELFSLYEDLRKRAENLVFIDLTLAENVNQAELNSIQEICNKNFTGKVILSERLDNELISGGVAQIGNRVIDASIAGRLHAMRNMLQK